MTPLWALLVVYWTSAISSRLNIGHRHLLPVYPALYILAGGSAAWLNPRHRIGAVTVGGLLAWWVAESARSYPHDLAYFNQVVGRREAYKHLIDSNLDWGQDLPSLSRWLDAHNPPGPGRRTVYLAYFGSGSASYYGIRAVGLPLLTARGPGVAPLEGGIYCVSATNLQSVYARFLGPWNRKYEGRYAEVRNELRRLGLLATDGSGTTRPVSGESESVRDAVEEFTALRSARLMAYLRHRKPYDEVAYSLLIFVLTDEEVRDALEGPPRELEDQSVWEREGAKKVSPIGPLPGDRPGGLP
jgi:hypothetical protein